MEPHKKEKKKGKKSHRKSSSSTDPWRASDSFEAGRDSRRSGSSASLASSSSSSDVTQPQLLRQDSSNGSKSSSKIFESPREGRARIFDPSYDSPSRRSTPSFRESASYTGGEAASYYGSAGRESYSLYEKPAPPVLPDAERFPKKRKIRDGAVAIIFVLHFVLFIGLGIASVAWNWNSSGGSGAGSGSSSSSSSSSGSDSSGSEEPPVLPLPDFSFLFIVAVSVITGVALSAIWALMMKAAGGATTVLSMILTIVFFFIIIAICFSYEWWWAIIIVLGVLVLFILFMVLFWRRMKFAMEVLRGVSTLLKGHTRAVFFGICCSVFPLAFYFYLWFGMFRSIVIRMENEGIAYVGVLMEIYFFLSFYWTFFTMKNVVHATYCYFFCQKYFNEEINGLMKPLSKVIGTNFGSCCVGALAGPIVKFFRGFFALFSTCNDCGVNCIDSVGKYFNRFTFVHVAMYGNTYCNSAKSAWDMFLLHGFTAVVNQDMTGELLTISVLSVGAITGLIAIFLSVVFYEATFAQGLLLMVVGLVLGLMTTNMVVEIFDAGAACLLVCFVEAPERLKELDPNFYEKFQALWGWILPLFPPRQQELSSASSHDLLRSRQSFTQV